MPSASQSPATEKDAFEWIERKTRQKRLRYRLYTGGTRRLGQVLEIPMWIDVRDAWEMATKMQQIENSWNNRRVRPDLQIFLVPAGRPLTSTKRKA